MSSFSLPLAAEGLIPHRLPMRLVEKLLEVDGKKAIVAAQIAVECPLVDSTGKLEDIVLVELIAQSHAVLNGYYDQLNARPVRQGFLVEVKKAEWFGVAYAGEKLLVRIDTLANLDAFTIATGEVWRGDTLLASGEIKVWVSS
ncbi:MAG: 3-hydroxyacyl-ACP dehydratase [Thermodesulfobacteriota bacterium]|nr:3-hydroxyacyl-ACP dehydratase [Thermodesulfobacteriota bacterium]